MLQFARTLLPQSELTYAAFRLACQDTRERLELAYQLDLSRDHGFGFLTEVPFLKSVPVQVQIDLLMEVWDRHTQETTYQATLLDEAVVYAACETAARIVRIEPEIARRILSRGPEPFERSIQQQDSDSLQRLHLDCSQEGLFLVLGQFQDLPPRDARILKHQYGLHEDACDCLFDALGRWYVSPELLVRARGLLTRVEREQLGSLLVATCNGRALA